MLNQTSGATAPDRDRRPGGGADDLHRRRDRLQPAPSAGLTAFPQVWKQLRPGWRSPQHAQLWLSSLERYAVPRIGKMPISEVTSADVIGILAPIWHDMPPTARKLRQRIRAVMEWAVAMGLRPDNPCDRIGPVLGSQGDVVRHMRAVPHGFRSSFRDWAAEELAGADLHPHVASSASHVPLPLGGSEGAQPPASPCRGPAKRGPKG